MKKPLSTKERVETWIGERRFLVLFSKIWNIGAIWKVERIGERAEPWPILISALKNEDTN